MFPASRKWRGKQNGRVQAVKHGLDGRGNSPTCNVQLRRKPTNLVVDVGEIHVFHSRDREAQTWLNSLLVAVFTGWSPAVACGAELCCAVPCGAEWCCAVLNGAVLCPAVLKPCCTVPCGADLCCTALCGAELCCAVTCGPGWCRAVLSGAQLCAISLALRGTQRHRLNSAGPRQKRDHVQRKHSDSTEEMNGGIE